MSASIQSQRNLSIETLRGIAILLVVMGHVIGSAPDGGMKIDFPSPWRYLYSWIDYIQMPLFTAIAGWVYALRPIREGSFSSFTFKKVKRLLIPMATVGTLYFMVQYLVPETNNKGTLTDIWRIYVFPYSIYWYLPSLFLIFLAMATADLKGWTKTFRGWALFLISSYLFYLLQHEFISGKLPNFFSFQGALDQLPYFVAGVGIQRFNKQIFTPSLIKKVYLPMSIIGIVILQIKWFYPTSIADFYVDLLPLWIIAALFLLLHQTFQNRFFVWIGGYAYGIYLFHGFGTSGGRIILSYLHIHNELCVFLFAFVLATSCSIIACKVAKQCRITRLLFLGEK
ncbi:MAG: acyltransferase [Tannerellaceae bacterium]